MKNLKAKWITKNPKSRLYQIPVPIIGLTGGIGTGKSTVAQILHEKNIPIIDADKLVKNIYQKPETLDFIAKNFPSVIENQSINFNKLREIVFANSQSKKLIEDFIYEHLPSEFKQTFSTFKNPAFIVYDVPLLFEKKLNEYIDLSICVYAPKEKQIERIISRDHSNRELALKIVESQMDIEQKKLNADLVIPNTAGPLELKNLVEQLLQEITD